MTSAYPTPAPCRWFSRLARPLTRRSAPRHALLSLGILLARGRRTVTSGIRGARTSHQFQPFFLADFPESPCHRLPRPPIAT